MKKKLILIPLILSCMFCAFSEDAEYCFNQANALFAEKNYAQSQGYYEYIISHGNLYAQDIYEEALQKLFVVYNNTNQIEASVLLYKKLNPADFSPDAFKTISDLAARANYFFELENLCHEVLENPSDKEALEKLTAVDITTVDDKNLSNLYRSAAVYSYAKMENWEKVLYYAEDLTFEDENLIYAVAAASYKTNQYEKVCSYVESLPKKSQTYELNILKAQSLCALKKYSEAVKVYADCEKSLDKPARLEYAKALYCAKDYKKSAEQALLSEKPEGIYLAGLCEYNQKNYAGADVHFKNYAKTRNTVKEYLANSWYYAGLGAYKRGLYADVNTDFRNAQNSLTDTQKLKNCYETGAKAALLLGKYNAAQEEAKKLIQVTSGKEQQDAVLFLADIYCDNKKYNDAVTLLEPYSKQKDDFGAVCLLKKAQIYEKSGDINLADATYRDIYTVYKNTAQAEEAMYRCGEIFYSARDYKAAEERFNTYFNYYINGKFCDAAYYYSGDCNYKLENYARCVMQNQTLVSNYPDSVYCYGGYKNMIEAYYKMKNYMEALSTARTLLRKYKEQAISDDIGTRIAGLEKIVNGTDPRIAEKYNEYDKLGKDTTKQGRISGSELAALYKAYGTEEEAVTLAQQLLASQNEKDSDEMPYVAANAKLCAEYYLKNGESREAAQNYLKAALCFRGCGNDNEAASCLYSATDSFVTAGLKADARDTSKLLIQLYPDSKYAKRVSQLVK